MAIVSQVPSNFATNVIRNVFIQVKFDETLDRTTISNYTVIVVESDNPDIIVDGRVDYIVGTNTVTFQLFDFLKSDTNYTVILVGGTNGIYRLAPHEPFSSNNYTFSFTTGSSIDWNLPLATTAGFEDGPYFDGHDGIYREVFGRTGEPVSHIVTTSAQVSPSGVIVPAPWGPDRYLPPSGQYDEDAFRLLSTSPSDDATGISASSNITFNFNSDLASIGSVTIFVSDILGDELTDESDLSNYKLTMSGAHYTISPSGVLTALRGASDYEVTLYDVEDIIGRAIPNIHLTFRTKVFPLYTTVKKIRHNLGQLIAQITDAEITEMIYDNSLWAFNNAETPFLIDNPPAEAINYVYCKTKLDLLDRNYIKSGAIESKQLADLKITYGPAVTQMIIRKAEKLEDCVKRNELLLTTGADHVKPVTADKSYWDPRRPNTSWRRLGDSGDFDEDI